MEDNICYQKVYQETWEIMFAMQISLQNTNLIHCASHLSWRDQCSLDGCSPRTATNQILLVLRMSLRIAALNNGNILSCSDQRISELYKSVKSKSMPAIQVWRKAKMDHECSSWPTEAPTRLIQLIGLKQRYKSWHKITKVLGKKTKFQQFHSSARAIHTKATLTEFEHHLTNIHITCRDLTMRYPVWVCECVHGRSMAWTAAKRKMAVQTKVSKPSTVKHGIKSFFQTSYPRSTETSHWSSGVHNFCEFSWALLNVVSRSFYIHEFHTSIPSVLFKTSGSLPVSSLLRRHAVPWMQFRQLQEHSRSSSQKQDIDIRRSSKQKNDCNHDLGMHDYIYIYIYIKIQAEYRQCCHFFLKSGLNKFQAFRASALLLIVSGLPLIGVNLCHHNAGPIS